jgi:dTDP-glucose 4,6-dehydratase
METSVVTGGAGFIGSNFVRLALEQTEARVIVVDKLTYAGNLCSLDDVAHHPRFVFERGDIADRAFVSRLYREYRPAQVVNFAAETHVDRSIDGPRAFLYTNVDGTFELLEAARGYLAELDEEPCSRFRFLHVSTDEVYGTLGDNGTFSEESPYAPNSPYAASKAAADHFARAYHTTYGLPVLLTNCSNNYGPYQYPEKLIPLMILNAVDGKPLPIYGDGGNVRDWLYVTDHCEGILRVLQRGTVGERYNIGGGNEQNNIAIVDLICDTLEELLPAARNPAVGGRGVLSYRDLKTFVQDRPGHDRRYAIDATRMRTELGWQPRCSFAEGIRNTVCWYLEHRNWVETVQARGYQRERLGLGQEIGNRRQKSECDGQTR